METTLEGPSDYDRIAAAIEFITQNHLLQPSLDDVAQGVGLSPFHFQRVFSRWAGVSPKKFLQFTTLTYARQILQTPGATLFDAAVDSGLSGTGRLHDLFIRFIAMTPGEYKNGGEQLQINFQFLPTIFGEALIAKTQRGICHLMFEKNRDEGMENLKSAFPNALFTETDDPVFHNAVRIIGQEMPLEPLHIHLKGSPFQIKVWEALLNIPPGSAASYGKLAGYLNFEKSAARAVGTAIGKNPVAYLIPCHRVIQANGLPGGYRWGLTRKKIMMAYEGVTSDSPEK